MAKVLAFLALVVILVVFIIANSKSVPVSFVFVTRNPPLIWVMLACAVLGGIIGYVIGRPGREIRMGRAGRRGRGGSEERTR